MLGVDQIISSNLCTANQALADYLDAEVIMLRSPLVIRVDDIIRECIESLAESAKNKKTKLCVVLETNGGQIEIVERINNVFRAHYQEVVYIIPNFAYSAGTVLVLSGDEIYMDYYAVLGPIDPQIQSGNKLLPGLGYQVEFENLLQKINKDQNGTNTKAEMIFLLKKFDPAHLFLLKQAREHAIDLLKEWLPKYKFKSWNETETQKLPVTEEMKKERANAIASILGDPERWHSHGRGICLKDLTSNEIKLKIKDFQLDPELNQAIKNYYRLIVDYFTSRNIQNAIHSRLGIRRL